MNSIIPAHIVFALSPSVNVKELLFVSIATFATIVFVKPPFPFNSVLKGA